MPTISKEFSLEPAMQGIILSAFFWSYALLQIPGGWLIDRFGPRALITGVGTPHSYHTVAPFRATKRVPAAPKEGQTKTEAA